MFTKSKAFYIHKATLTCFNRDFFKASVTSPVDEGLCLVNSPNKLEVFVSCLDDGLSLPSRLNAAAVFKVYFFRLFPAGFEELLEKLSKVLGDGWTLPADTPLLRYNPPPRV